MDRELVEFKIALAIFNRHLRIKSAESILEYVKELQTAQAEVEEFESVVFLHDCFKRAMQKATKAWSFEAKITRKWKDYDKFVGLLPSIAENHVNPFAFFYFKIQDFRSKKIYPKISNVVTKRALDHFISWSKTNKYRVAIVAQEKSYETEWLNQLSIDVQSLVSYQLRKPVVSLTKPEGFLFSGLGKALINHYQHTGFEVDADEQNQWQELLKDEELHKRTIAYWNSCIVREQAKLNTLYRAMRDKNFIIKLDELVKLLTVLQIT